MSSCGFTGCGDSASLGLRRYRLGGYDNRTRNGSLKNGGGSFREVPVYAEEWLSPEPYGTGPSGCYFETNLFGAEEWPSGCPLVGASGSLPAVLRPALQADVHSAGRGCSGKADA